MPAELGPRGGADFPDPGVSWQRRHHQGGSPTRTLSVFLMKPGNWRRRETVERELTELTEPLSTPELENDFILGFCKPLPNKWVSLSFLASRIHPLG